MSQLSEFEEELLTGFLDDQLTSEEVRSVQDLLAKSAEARSRLSVLRRLTSDVKSLPSSSLGTDFSARVITIARNQAIEAGLPKDHHVLAGNSDQVFSTPSDVLVDSNANRSWTLQLRWAAGMAALAASVLFVVYLARQTEISDPRPLLTSNETQLPTVAAPQTELASNSTGNRKSPLETAIEASMQGSGSVPVASTNDPNVQNVPPATVVQQLAPVQLSMLLLVVDVTLSKSAWQEEAFRRVLENAGIIITSPIVADEKLQKSVEDSLMIVNAPNSTTAQSKVPKVGLLLVHSEAKKLDKAMMDLYSRPLDFPELSFNLAFDQADVNLFKQLRSGSGLAVEPSSGPQCARPIVVKDDQVSGISGIDQFAGTRKRTNLISSANRSKGWPKLSAEIGDVSMNPQTESLFVIRQPAGE